MKRVSWVILLSLIFVFSAWTFSMQQSLTLYDFEKMHHFPTMPLDENNLVTNEGVELGRHLFYDPILSEDSMFSCATCHRQESAFSDAPNAISLGIHQDELKRNTLPLFNLAWYDRMFWDGKAESIEEQVFHPVAAHDEMNLSWEEATFRIRSSDRYPDMFRKAFGDIEIDSVLISKAIAQFERTLISHNSKFDKALRKEAKLSASEYAGLVLMNEQNKGNCLHCHTSDANALGTTGGFSNNGLDNAVNASDFKDAGRGEQSNMEEDFGKFKIPSIRNLVFTAPYMHDGRFETLEEVLKFYSEEVNVSPTLDPKMTTAHQGGVRLTEDEQSKIIDFLHALTDSSFVTDKRFSAPF